MTAEPGEKVAASDISPSIVPFLEGQHAVIMRQVAPAVPFAKQQLSLSGNGAHTRLAWYPIVQRGMQASAANYWPHDGNHAANMCLRPRAMTAAALHGHPFCLVEDASWRCQHATPCCPGNELASEPPDHQMLRISVASLVLLGVGAMACASWPSVLVCCFDPAVPGRYRQVEAGSSGGPFARVRQEIQGRDSGSSRAVVVPRYVRGAIA